MNDGSAMSKWPASALGGGGATTELLDHGPAGGVGEGGEDLVERSGAVAMSATMTPSDT